MTRDDRWEQRADLLQAVHAAGFTLSEPRLGRLHRGDLVPSPRTRSLGRGKGTVSEFPPGSTTRLLRVLDLQRREGTQRLSTLAWRLWWEDGGRLPAATRKLLVEVASRWDQNRDQLAQLLEREEEGDPYAEGEMERLYRSAERDRAAGAVAVARRNTGREGFSSVVRVLAEVATGRFESYGDAGDAGDDGAPPAGTTGALVERALGLDHAREDRIAGGEPRFSGSSEEHFRLLSRLVGNRQLTPLATESSDGELDQARSEIHGLLSLISVFAPMVERVLGGDAAGYRTIARALNVHTPRLQALILLGWLALRDQPELLEGLRELAERLPQARAASQLEELAGQLAQEVPALAPAIEHAARANLRGDAVEAARWQAEIARVSGEHRSQVDDFFRRHPETEGLIAAAEDRAR